MMSVQELELELLRRSETAKQREVRQMHLELLLLLLLLLQLLPLLLVKLRNCLNVSASLEVLMLLLVSLPHPPPMRLRRNKSFSLSVVTVFYSFVILFFLSFCVSSIVLSTLDRYERALRLNMQLRRRSRRIKGTNKQTYDTLNEWY
jgi:hypothetical protein